MIKILRKGEYELEDVLIRDRSGRDVSKVVEEILFSVKMGGDPTLLNYCETLDGARPERLELTAEEIDEAIKEVSDEVKETLQEAADRIAAYHREQLKEGYTIEANGVTLKQRVLPIEKVGIYIPGGTAAYPSTVLMNAVPAKIAGVKEIVMVSPPTAGGTISPVILAAARIAGVDRVFRIGGAQAVAALAYGTKSVPKVDKIVGPGNAYVAEAKKQVFGQVGIDLIAGPSEILVVADEGSDARIVAADMLSQALWHSPSGFCQPLAMNTRPSCRSQACSMGFSYRAIRSSYRAIRITVILHFFIVPPPVPRPAPARPRQFPLRPDRPYPYR